MSQTKSVALEYVLRCCGERRIELLPKSGVASFHSHRVFYPFHIDRKMCVCLYVYVCMYFGTYEYGYFYTLKNIYLKIGGKRVVGQDL